MTLPLPTLVPTQPRDGVERLSLEDVPLAVVTHQGLRTHDLRDVFDSSFGAIGAAIGQGLVQPLGPAIALYRGDPSGVFDLSIGFPVATPLDAPVEQDGVRIEHDVIPAGSWAATSHVGGYDGLAGAWEGLVGAVVQDGARPAGTWAEVYVTEPSPQADPATMRTDLLVATVVDEAR